MKKRLKNVGIILLAGFLTQVCLAQNSSVLSLQKSFVDYNNELLQEKIYAHTDKEYYLAGELMWFKLYYVDGFFHKPLDISKVAYAELLDKNNKPVLQGKISLKEGSGNGSFFLPVTLQSGNYKLRCYTNWMKNFDAQYFFEKSISVVNAQRIPESSVAEIKSNYDIQFFPEGGNLVSGLESNVAFRIANQFGKGMNANAVVVSNSGDTVIRFTAGKFGLGSFRFTPNAGATYNAIVKISDSIQVKANLPKVLSDGLVMTANSDAQGKISVNVQGSSSQSGEVLLFVHTRNAMKSAQTATLQNGRATFAIDEDKLGEGVSHFTLFDLAKRPVAERLYFRYPRSLTIQVSSNRESYGPRTKAGIDIIAKDDDGIKPVDMSMAVYRVDSLQATEAINIHQYLWLSSDLSGTVESPAYYFDEKEADRKQAMDLLMLTHGWRKFAWNDIVANNKPVVSFVPEFNGHVINGRVFGPGGKSQEGKIAYLSMPSTKTLFKGTISDAQGRVRFEMKAFYGGSEVVAQLIGEQDSLSQVEISSPFAEKYSGSLLPPFMLPAKSPLTLTDNFVNTQVRNIYTADKQLRFFDLADSSDFYGRPDMRYMLDDYTRFTTMEEVFREYVLPVNVRKRDGKFHLPVYDEVTKLLFQGDPLVLVDGVYVSDLNKLMSYDPHKIRKLDVMSRKYFLGNFSFDGVVNMHTYNGDVAVNQLDPRAILIDYEGLQMQREFFSPVYETPQQFANRIPDFRTLLYWAPDIKTDQSGKKQLNFFTSDIPGKYAVVLQGLSSDGKTGSKTIYFEVKDAPNVANK